jgi:hypothetical protein
VGAFTPLAQSCGGGGGDGAWGGRRGACRQAAHERGGVHRRGAGARRCDGGGRGDRNTGGGNNVRQVPEEKEARIFHPEVGDYFPLIVFFSQLGPNSLAFVLAGWRPTCPLSRLPRC